MSCLFREGFVSLACLLLASGSWADSVSSPGERYQARRSSAHKASSVRLMSWRAHNLCPMEGSVGSVRSVDSLREWRDTLTADEAGAVGRRVMWSREKVLVYALPMQPAAATQLEPASSVLRLSDGILWWPVKRSPPSAIAAPITVKTRPCLIGLVNRAQWHRIRIVERQI